ncbi:MAG: folylpolyglutamate synthase/dihydrofolate synthase family protein [Candidatus Andersenbacteria bacterium]
MAVFFLTKTLPSARIMSVTDVHQEIEYLYGLERFGIKLGLDVMHELMDILDHPETKFKSVHITGTTGKGSTASFLANILQQAGYKVGLYTSPHLFTFNERVRINGQPIPDETLLTLITDIRTKSEAQGIQQTFFEFTTALAYQYFAQEKVDIAIVEVGFGGKLDATNVITPLLSIITNVGLDHMDVLGNTKEEIARDKAGVIKPNIPILTNEKEEHILDIFAQEANLKHSPFHQVKDIVSGIQISQSLDSQTIELRTKEDTFTVETTLLGSHQVHNICTAVAAATLLGNLGFNVSRPVLREGIRTNHWKGRMEIVSKQPLIIIDGAHNQPGMEALAAFVKELPNRRALVVAFKQGKDPLQVIEPLAHLFDHIIITEGSYEPLATDAVAQSLTPLAISLEEIPNVTDAVQRAQELAGEDGTIVITGSLYMISDALNVFPAA